MATITYTSSLIIHLGNNFTRNPLRRLEFMVGVSVDFNLQEARKLGLKRWPPRLGFCQIRGTWY
jgi:hypothetical protein